jgi:rhamnulose-1-phosphate aldolase
MKSILDNYPRAKAEVLKAAEVAGYLWQKGWAERNGGNITVNITELVDVDALSALPALAPALPIGMSLPHIKGCIFYCKGTGRRMRDLARSPMDNGSIIRILPDGQNYEMIADQPVRPTSELPSHLAIHNDLLAKGSTFRAAIHTHPIELVAMSHNPEFLEPGVLTRLLWSMIPETRAFCPKGLGIIRYEMPSSVHLALDTVRGLQDHNVVLWEKHGVVAVGNDALEAFDEIDVLAKSAQIYRDAKSMGFEPTGMTDAAMNELKEAFNL